MIATEITYNLIASTAGRFVAQRQPLLILMYHRIQDHPRGTDYVPIHVFRQHISYLIDEGFRFLSMRQVFENWPTVLTGPKTAVLTFDDLWASQIDECLPVMRQHGCVGTFFVPTAHIGDRRQRLSRAPFACFQSDLGSWQDVELLEHNGMEIGAHTHTHARMSDLDQNEVVEELSTSNRILSGIVQSPITSFAFPFGRPSSYTPWIVSLLPAFGYKTACTTQWGRPVSESNLLELPRIAIDGLDDLARFAKKIEGHYDFLRWLRR